MALSVDALYGSGDEELDRLLDEFKGEVTALDQLQEQIAGLRGRGEAVEGRVVAEVTLTGTLAGLTIDPRAMRLGSADLAEAVLLAAREAAGDAERKARDLVGPFVAGTPLDPLPPFQGSP
ncbi:YbaB/EbfC family nucleoid-associated protein [Nonomuraea lactucae]|uniref:YbaB/EbfC family nucleoid-associated protein n=1 Tax=Nonomuraea lactucae TaxID=2249762 RepID=UPI0013B4429D|nr:YbaB/EbfC family nucleoid-associated protein [Nonomuraea lactucae]